MTELLLPPPETGDPHNQSEHWHPVELVETSRVTQRYKALLRDSSKLLREKSAYQELAEQNPVSGLPNRRSFDNALIELIEQAEHGGPQDIGVAFLDLNGFKKVNDMLGHDKGDEVLRATGRKLQQVVRDGDMVVHFGGDEFAVIMPNLFRDEKHQNRDREELIQRLSERFLDAALLAAEEVGAGSSASVGISIYEKGDTPESLTKKADDAMYMNKIFSKEFARTQA